MVTRDYMFIDSLVQLDVYTSVPVCTISTVCSVSSHVILVMYIK